MGFSQILYSWTAIFPVIILLYYFFRKKYTDQPVSSTLFWAEIMQETRVSPYLKHLQKNALLYLQLLALLLLMLALMNPFIQQSKIAGSQVVFIVDTSATMLAGKEQATFELHKQEMLSLINDLNGRPITLIVTGHAPTAVLQQETNINAIEQVIQALQVTYETAQMPKALDVAQAFIGDSPTSVYIFTDTLDKMQLPVEKETVQWIVKGAAKDLKNITITRFAATTDGQTAMALVQLRNDTNEAQETILTLYDAENQELVNEKVALPAKEIVTTTFKELPVTQTITAKIDAQDHYTVDNTQTALLQTTSAALVVDQSLHQLIQKGFQAIQPNVKMVPALQLTDNEDAVIVTNQAALLGEVKKPVILFGRDDVEKFEAVGHVNTTNDALFAFSNLKDVYVGVLYESFDNYKTIATVGEEPFIQLSPEGDIIVLADIEDTDWPLHPSFPLFLWSAEQQLLESTSSLGIFAPNESRVVALAQSDWSVYSQTDEFLSTVTNGILTAPMKPDIYIVRSADEEKHFIVQLQAQERIIEEGTSYTIGALPDNEQEELSKSSIVPWIVLLVLLLLVVEWEVQRRRGFTN